MGLQISNGPQNNENKSCIIIFEESVFETHILMGLSACKFDYIQI